MRAFSRVGLIVAALALAGSVLSAQAAKPLATADAGKFMGAWLLTLESPQGALNMTLTLTDNAGKVAAEISSDMMPTQKVEDISKAGNDLVLKMENGTLRHVNVPESATATVDDKQIGIHDLKVGMKLQKTITTTATPTIITKVETVQRKLFHVNPPAT